MSDGFTSIIRFEITDGQTDAFIALAKKCAEAVSADEPGVSRYSWYVDGNNCLIHEDYDSSEAFIDHLRGPVGKDLLPQVLEIAKMKAVTVMGTPNEKAEKVLDSWGALKLGAPAAEIRR
ncbi:MAG: putative quinol monooxygenase [Actinomycetota bacterium]